MYSFEQVDIDKVNIAEYPFLIPMRNLALRIYWLLLKVKGFGKRRNTPLTKTYNDEVTNES
jgi:hypothetical protein